MAPASICFDFLHHLHCAKRAIALSAQNQPKRGTHVTNSYLSFSYLEEQVPCKTFFHVKVRSVDSTATRTPSWLGKPQFEKGRVYLGIAQIAIAPPPLHSNGHSGALVFGHYFYHFEGLYASGNGNIWSAFIQQWVYASNVQLWGLQKFTPHA